MSGASRYRVVITFSLRLVTREAELLHLVFVVLDANIELILGVLVVRFEEFWLSFAATKLR